MSKKQERPPSHSAVLRRLREQLPSATDLLRAKVSIHKRLVIELSVDSHRTTLIDTLDLQSDVRPHYFFPEKQICLYISLSSSEVFIAPNSIIPAQIPITFLILPLPVPEA